MTRMIVDVHTHAFPPSLIARREALVRTDAQFAELYGDPATRMATADELLASMEEAAVDVSVVAGFWWRDPAVAEEHTAYLLEAAAASAGRLLPFVPAPARNAAASLVARGARGVGEVRPANRLTPELALEHDAAAAGLPLLLHSSEEPGHAYPGKAGGYSIGMLWRVLTQTDARVIAAHWGAGFPFYALMPEVQTHLIADRMLFDTAATRFLYDPAIFETVFALVGERAVAWGSDFPLRPQDADRRLLEQAVTDAEARAAVLGGNAARFLGLAE